MPALKATDKRGVLEELATYMAERHAKIDRETGQPAIVEPPKKPVGPRPVAPPAKF